VCYASSFLEGCPSKVLGNFSSKYKGKKKDKVLMWRAFRGKRKEGGGKGRGGW
jgi:hypothetical protein